MQSPLQTISAFYHRPVKFPKKHLVKFNYILKFSKNYQQCNIIKVNLKNMKIRKIDNNQWIGIFPIDQPAISTCGQEKEHLSVKGSYVITAPDGCKPRIYSTTLQSYQNPEFKKQASQTIPLMFRQF